jgi:acyl-CoA hydrolase
MDETAKPVAYSRSEQIQFIMPRHANRFGRLFGGQLMAWIDIIAAVVAFRHSGGDCTTAAVDCLNFEKPISTRDLIVLDARVTCVGNSSMEIRVDTFIEREGLVREHANRAYVTYVAIDGEGRPRRVPRLELQTDEDKAEFAAGLERARLRKERRIKDAGTGPPAV